MRFSCVIFTIYFLKSIKNSITEIEFLKKKDINFVEIRSINIRYHGVTKHYNSKESNILNPRNRSL